MKDSDSLPAFPSVGVVDESNVGSSIGAWLLARVDDVATDLFVALQLEQPTLLRFEEEFVEGTEPMCSLVETGVLPFHGLFHE